MKVAVVTPTIGTQHFAQCVKSVQNQTHEDIVHYIFVDGSEHYETVYETLGEHVKTRDIETITLSCNIGKGWYGHRVYAACSFLVDADVICYLDEDNWMEPDHVEGLVEVINHGYPWAYSLRKIYSKEGSFLCDDNCESLGHWPVYFDRDVHHIDTSCFAIKKEVAVAVGHSWYAQWGADRRFFATLKQYFPTFKGSHRHSLCYRLDGNPGSVTEDFFKTGNRLNAIKYNNQFPW